MIRSVSRTPTLHQASGLRPQESMALIVVREEMPPLEWVVSGHESRARAN